MIKGHIGNENVDFIEKDGVVLVQFKNLKAHEDKLIHCFTTRIGGVSEGECNTLNLGFSRKDNRENVLENYRRVSKALGIDCENMVLSNQVHEDRIKVVDEKDRGKGITRATDILGYDGLMTDSRNVALVTFYADCVPVLFFDAEKRVIAASHSGWRGTAKEIAAATIRKMTDELHCAAKDIQVAIGPSIGKCCFEVGAEVYEEFVDKLPWSEKHCEKKQNGKWHIDLQSIINTTLLNAGINIKNIVKSEVCTRCNKDIFFSHRGDLGKTGSLAAIMQLK